MPLTKIKLNEMTTGTLPDSQIPDNITITGSQTGITAVGELASNLLLSNNVELRSKDSGGFLRMGDSSNNELILFRSYGVSFINSGNFGLGEQNPSAPLHIKKLSGANNVVELLRLDMQETSHQSGKGGKIVFRDISVYTDTATLEAQRNGLSGNSEFRIRLRNNSSTFMFNNSNQCFNAGNNSSWNTSSDKRIKKNIKSIINGLEKINAINPVSFDYKQGWINEKEPSKASKNGFIAQEYKEIFPDAVSESEVSVDGTTYEDFLSMDTDDLLPYLVKAVQELSSKVEALENA